MPILQVLIASTRPGRAGLPVGTWFVEHATAHGKFTVETVDLAEVNLPLMDEPNHPRLRQYVNAHTHAWSASVARADAFVFVMPEYNYSFTAPLKNALDYLHAEWQYKPVGFVSYGGISGGLRAVQGIKQVVTTLNMMPLPEGVAIPFVTQHIDEHQHFIATEQMQKSADVMLDQLARWSEALAVLRQPAKG
jgi:NAD(P)H-dependent FMN reductase